MVQLVVVKGPLVGKTFEVTDNTIIGRSVDCQVRLDDLTVSRVHARIERRSQGYLLIDLGSKNGTHVNGQEVKGLQTSAIYGRGYFLCGLTNRAKQGID